MDLLKLTEVGNRSPVTNYVQPTQDAWVSPGPLRSIAQVVHYVDGTILMTKVLSMPILVELYVRVV
jgi:hypothetical protein